jgi:hypothetical protein
MEIVIHNRARLETAFFARSVPCVLRTCIVVVFAVHESDGAHHAAHLVMRTSRAQGQPWDACQAGATWRQRLDAQGHDGAGDAALAGR